MSANSSIEWTDKTWNPVRGCSVISPGCINCYAMKQAHRFSGAGKPYEGLTKQTGAGPQWTGAIRVVQDSLKEPLSWRKPQRIFVNSMSDLFHEDVPVDFIAEVFATMRAASRHTFQILTKRADRLRDIVGDPLFKERVDALTEPEQPWPLPNVLLGVSVEDQKRADERFPIVCELGESSWRTMVSMEPLLELVVIPERYLRLGALAWIILGGESGKGGRVRPFDINWARAAITQCRNFGVACFLKQLGSRPFWAELLCVFDSYTQWVNKARSWLGGISGGGVKYKKPERAVCVDQRGRVCHIGRDFMRASDEGAFPVRAFAEFPLVDSAGSDPSEWPADLRVREYPEVAA